MISKSGDTEINWKALAYAKGKLHHHGLLDRIDAEEVVNDAWMAAERTFRPDGGLSWFSWLKMKIRYRVLDECRKGQDHAIDSTKPGEFGERSGAEMGDMAISEKNGVNLDGAEDCFSVVVALINSYCDDAQKAIPHLISVLCTPENCHAINRYWYRRFLIGWCLSTSREVSQLPNRLPAPIRRWQQTHKLIFEGRLSYHQRGHTPNES